MHAKASSEKLAGMRWPQPSLRVLLLALVAWVVCPEAVASDTEEEQTVRFEVVHLEGEELASVMVMARWLGKSQTVMLTDDGVAPDKVATDEIWTGELTGGMVRLLPVELWAYCGSTGISEAKQVYAGLELIREGDNTLAYAISRDCDAPATRVLQAESVALQPDKDLVGYHASWMVFGLFLVAFAARRPRDDAPLPEAKGRMWPWLFVWVALAVVFTWPAALAGPDLWVGRHFDLPGTIWSLSAIPRFDWGFTDPLTSWPRGADYSRFDSYTLLPVGHLFSFVHPSRLHGFLQIIGVAVSAWAAQGFARSVGARSPWDLLAGLAFAFSGMASTALLEGHVYLLFDPWMPLFAWVWFKAMSGSGTTRQGILAGALYSLTLLTTAYLGMAATLIAVGFFVGGVLAHGRRVLRPAMAAWIPIVPVLAGLVWVSLSGDQALHDTSVASIQLGSANLLNLLGPLPQIDFDGHSIAPVLSPVVVGLMIIAPLMVPRWRSRRVLWWTALGSIVIGLGISLDADGNSPLIPLPLFWVVETFEARWFRFPSRMVWVWGLCAGVVSAVVLTVIARRSRVAASLLMICALVHVFLGVRHTERQWTYPGGAPSAYSHVSGPVLDLFPEGSDQAQEEDMWFSALACAYQIEHGLPLAENCVSTVPQDNPRSILGRVVRAQLLAGEVGFVEDTLSSIGFVAVALHIDLFSEGDADRMRTALERFGAPIVETTDGGERIVLLPLPSGVETQNLFQSQRVAIFEAASDTHFSTKSSIGLVLAEADQALHEDRTIQLEVRESVVAARDIAVWKATAEWEGGSQTLRFFDPHEEVREEEDLEFRWLAKWWGKIPSPFTLTVTGVGLSGEVQTEWQGEVYSRVRDDRLVFKYGTSGIHPIVPTAALSTPLRDSDAGLLAAGFWGVYFFLAMFVWLWVRSRQDGSEDSQAASNPANTSA